MKYAEDHPGQTQGQMAKALGLSRNWVNKLLAAHRDAPLNTKHRPPLKAIERARAVKTQRRVENQRRVVEARLAHPYASAAEIARKVGLSNTYTYRLLKEAGMGAGVYGAAQEKVRDSRLETLVEAAARMTEMDTETLFSSAARKTPAQRAVWMVAVDKGVPLEVIRGAFKASPHTVYTSVNQTRNRYEDETIDPETGALIDELGELL